MKAIHWLLPLTCVSLLITATDSGLGDVTDSAGDTTSLAKDEFIRVEVIAEMTYYEKPEYPRIAEQAGLEGTVWIKTLVGNDGSVKQVALHRSSGVWALDDAAMQAAPKCRFKPARQNGRPVAMWVTYKVEFELGDHDRRNTSSSGGHATMVTRCYLEKDITPLWELSSFDDTVALAPTTTSVNRRDFGILFLRTTDKKRRKLQHALILINGGCADGLRVGMTGAVWDKRGEDSVKLADVEVQDVQAFESMCLLKPLKGMVVSKYHDIIIDSASFRPEECLERGVAYFDAGDPERALACFERVSSTGDSSIIVATRVQDCRRKCADKLQNLSEFEKDEFREQIPSHVEVAESYIRLGDKAGAQRYLDKVFAVDSANTAAQEIAESLSQLDSCSIDLRSTGRTKKDSAGTFVAPILRFWTLPRYPYVTQVFDNEETARKDSPPGVVWVRALLSPTGRVLRAEVHKASGNTELDEAAVEEAYTYRFQPAVYCGQPTAMWVTWKVELRIEPFNLRP